MVLIWGQESWFGIKGGIKTNASMEKDHFNNAAWACFE